MDDMRSDPSRRRPRPPAGSGRGIDTPASLRRCPSSLMHRWAATTSEQLVGTFRRVDQRLRRGWRDRTCPELAQGAARHPDRADRRSLDPIHGGVPPSPRAVRHRRNDRDMALCIHLVYSQYDRASVCPSNGSPSRGTRNWRSRRASCARYRT